MRRGIVAALVTAGLGSCAAAAHGDPPYWGTGVRTLQVPSETMVPTIPAGGSVDAPDLVAAAGVALDEGVTVALVEQPYRVAGRRSPPPAPRLDAAWLAIVPQLPLDGLPLIVGGRSSGARVACRTAAQTG